MEDLCVVMTPEEVAEYYAEYEAWLDENIEFSEHLEEVFSGS